MCTPRMSKSRNVPIQRGSDASKSPWIPPSDADQTSIGANICVDEHAIGATISMSPPLTLAFFAFLIVKKKKKKMWQSFPFGDGTASSMMSKRHLTLSTYWSLRVTKTLKCSSGHVSAQIMSASTAVPTWGPSTSSMRSIMSLFDIRISSVSG